MKPSTYLSLSIILFTLLANVYGSIFIFYPIDTVFTPIAPPVIYYPSSSPGVSTVYIGANKTSAEVTVKATANPSELLTNGGFDSGPSPWLFYPGTYMNSAVWYPNLLGRTGVVNISGVATDFFVYDLAGLLQLFRWPDVPISTATLEVEARVVTSSLSPPLTMTFNIVYYILDTAYNTVDSGSTTVATGVGDTGWQILTFNINPALLTSGQDYYILVAGEVTALLGFGNEISLQLYFNYISLVVTPTKPFFTGVAIHLNNTVGVYNAQLILSGYTSNGNVNASIYLRNHTATATSTPIEFVNSIPSTTSTSELIITTVPPGYLSLDICVETVLDVGASLNITLIFRYRVGDGVYIDYPLIINVVDPPTIDTLPSRSVDEPIALARFDHQLPLNPLGDDI